MLLFAGKSSFQEAELPSSAVASPMELNRNAQMKYAQAVTAALTDNVLPNAELDKPQKESAAVKGGRIKSDIAPELSLESMSKAVEAELLAERRSPDRPKSLEETAGANDDDTNPEESSFVQNSETKSGSLHSKPSLPVFVIPSK